MNNRLVFFSAFFFYPVFVLANWCPQWSQPKAVGYLNSDVIDEASGIEVSPLSKQRLFHINDSGDGPHFYTSDLNGNDTKTISIKGFSPVDVEDLTLGPCLDKKSCLFIGDIGDNNKVREDIVVVLIEEKPSFDKEVSPSLTLRLKYPDGPHNAEGIAVHPNGDLYILTK